MSAAPLGAQLINLFAAILLLLAFAMLAQRRVLTLIDLFAAQGLALSVSTGIVAYATAQPHLYWSAGLTLVLKVVALSGGYSRDEANKRLARQNGMIASFSRALSEGLSAQQSDAEFNKSLDTAIESIYQASKT